MLEFYKFNDYELKHCLGYEFDEEFLEKFKTRKNMSCRNRIDYLHYGWVDTIPNYHKLVPTHPYTFGGMKRFIINKFSNADKHLYNLLDQLHSTCNGYVHGSIANSKYPLLHYFEITTILVTVTVNAYSAACDEIGDDKKVNGLDIIAEINKHFSIMKKAELMKSTDAFEGYYKNFKR